MEIIELSILVKFSDNIVFERPCLEHKCKTDYRTPKGTVVMFM